MAFKVAITRGLDKAGRALGILAYPWVMLIYSKSILILEGPIFSPQVGRVFSPQVLILVMLLRALVLVVFFFGLIGTLAGRRKDFMRFSVGLGPVWLLLFWAGFSLLWSVNPGVTLWGLLELAATTGFGMLFSFYYRIEEQLKILFLYVLTGVFLSLLLILFFPSWGISSGAHEGAWKGVFWHKNILGIHAAFGIVLLVLCGAEETRYRGAYWVGLVACLIFLVASRSLTAAASAFAGVATYAAVMSLRNPPWGLKRGYVAMAWVLGVVFCFLCIFLFFIKQY